MLFRIINRLSRTARKLRITVFSGYYRHLLKLPRGFIVVTDKCDISCEGMLSVGRGVFIRSKKHNQVEISVHKEGSLTIGEDVFINQGARIVATTFVTIGRGTHIGDEAIIIDNDFHGIDGRPPKKGPIEIGSNVWIASRAIILRNIKIGDHSVVSANSVVTKDVPPYCVVAGNPAVVVKRIDEIEG